MTRTDLAIRFTLLAAAVVVPGTTWIACADAGATLVQPLEFPHKAHADNEIGCVFCHENYESGAAAGIPETDLCVTCHSAMDQESPAVQTIFEYADAGQEIPWVRLYEIPKYTYFSHKWHVRAELDCSQCHGDIGQSQLAVRHMTYEMDWCVTCHEDTEAPTDCVVCHK